MFFPPLSPIHLPRAFQFDALFPPQPSIIGTFWQRNERLCLSPLDLRDPIVSDTFFRGEAFPTAAFCIWARRDLRPGAPGSSVGIQRRFFLHIALARRWHPSAETARRKAVPSQGRETDLHMRFQGSNQISQQVQ